jgi:hypothetical protein
MQILVFTISSKWRWVLTSFYLNIHFEWILLQIELLKGILILIDFGMQY